MKDPVGHDGDRFVKELPERFNELGSFIREQRSSARLSLRRLSELAGILAGPGRPSGLGRNPVLYTPDTDDMEALTTELDGILGVDEIGQLTGLSEDGLRAVATQLQELERRVSAERRGLHERIDSLQAELVERHKSGRASVDGLLS